MVSFRHPSKMEDLHGLQLEDPEDLARKIVAVDEDGVKTRDLDEHVDRQVKKLFFCQPASASSLSLRLTRRF
jgi:hypothetical protein